MNIIRFDGTAYVQVVGEGAVQLGDFILVGHAHATHLGRVRLAPDDTLVTIIDGATMLVKSNEGHEWTVEFP